MSWLNFVTAERIYPRRVFPVFRGKAVAAVSRAFGDGRLECNVGLSFESHV